MRKSDHKQKKRKQLQTVDLKVKMDCDGCELKVKKALSSLSGNFVVIFLYHNARKTAIDIFVNQCLRGYREKS